MSSLGSPSTLFLAKKGAYEVKRSLRFNDDDSAYLNRTFGSAGNRKTFTISAWIKLGSFVSTTRPIFSRYTANNEAGFLGLYVNTNHNLYFTGWSTIYFQTNRLFRDPSAWYHIVFAMDTTQSTNTNRWKLYINGTQETSFASTSYPSQDADLAINEAVAHMVGRYSTNYFDGYITELNFIDGSALTPSSFGKTDPITGQWNPKKYTGSYGTNGFYLNFSDNSGTTATTLGKDSSGNGNNFTPNNLAVSDAVKDSPTNNFCTFNPLSNYDNSTLSEGNLKVTGTGSDHSWQQVRGNMGVSSGKWYFEIRCNSIAANEGWIAGIHEVFGRDTEGYFWYSGGYTAAGYGYAYGVQDNNQRRTNGGSDDAFSSDVTAGKVVGFRLNLDDNEILISVDGVDKGKMYDIQSGITYSPAVNIYTTSSATLNCGQDSTFQGQESSGGNTDSGGIGDFAYAVPSGYKALCSANLPDPTIKLPNQHFNTVLYTGNNNTSQNITGVGFQPDFVWVKNRDNVERHHLVDAVRGDNKVLFSSETDSERTGSHGAGHTQLNLASDGFNLVSNGSNDELNFGTRTYVAWNWNAGGSTVTNNEGSKSAQVRANASAGFSIISYTGDGTSGTTVGHGLGVAPKIMFHKDRDSSNNWYTITTAVDGSADYLYLNLTNAKGNSAVTAPTSSLVYFTSSTESNANGRDYIMYAFSEVAGYSKFGSYTGNGSSDGTFIFLGFQPAWVMIKRISATEGWQIFDNKRDPDNVIENRIEANTTEGDVTSIDWLDFLSNGIKHRVNRTNTNTSGSTYIYLAFAESPFKYSRAR